MFVAYAVLASTMMPYGVTVYGMMSLIQNQPVWRQHSEGEDRGALSLLHCVLLLWIFSISPQVGSQKLVSHVLSKFYKSVQHKKISESKSLL